eukprot:4051072-Amphidinium_carterae.1
MAGTSYCQNTDGRHVQHEVITCGAWQGQRRMATSIFWRRTVILRVQSISASLKFVGDLSHETLPALLSLLVETSCSPGL